MSKRIVATNTLGYPQIRNFARADFEGYEVRKKLDLIKIPAWLYFKLTGKTHPYWTNMFWDLGLGKYSLLHFFNAVNRGNRPWITTFEHYLPRDAHRPGQVPKEDAYIRYVIKRISHPSCKRLIALSNYAKDAQNNYLDELGYGHEAILPKITVLHPPQKLYFQSMEEKVAMGERVRFCMIGAEFFRKGGKEVLNVFDRLLQEGLPLDLHIVSRLVYGDYASGTTEADLLKAKEIIGKHAHIYHTESMPNAEVMQLLQNSDVGLLPTYDDTYGYSVLESQACGCPVISTNGAALPEINNEQCGWLIPVPLVEDRRSVTRNREERDRFTQIVEEGLERIVREICSDVNVVRQKGQHALDRIRRDHDPATHTRSLESIYDAAISG